MPRVKKTFPSATRDKGQRSLDLPNWLERVLPPFSRPGWQNANVWRNIVLNQPIAALCRDTLVQYVNSLDWCIEPKDSLQREELRSEIEYYTEFFTDTGDYAYEEINEWIISDMLDTPFGGAAEIGRWKDDPEGKIVWIELLDSATLFPTLNRDWPVGQYLPEASFDPIYFPKHAVNRAYISPRREIKYKGWGMPPPEKIYLGLELLSRGDVYYAGLLLDTPEAGILDLGDMSKTSAEEWVKSFRDMLRGIDGFKIPVLYEHQNKVAWIPFGRPPTELMFDNITMKYAAMVAAGYGMSLSDIGIQVVTSGGETLAGSIRQERRTRRSGFGLVKKKMAAFFNRMLPDTLRWKYIDLDDEVLVAVTRARLANATAAAQYIADKVFSPKEMRLQAIADGLITISVPEDIPEEEFFDPPKENLDQPGDAPERPSILGRPVAPSAGGHGEIRSLIIDLLKDE